MFDAIRRIFSRAGPDATPASRPTSAPVPYKDFMIHPAARKQGSQWLTAGFITKSGPDGERRAEFIRSDQFVSRDDADACAVVKARKIIDEQGDRLFDREWP